MRRTRRKSNVDRDQYKNERHEARGRRRPAQREVDGWDVGDFDDLAFGEVTDEPHLQADDQGEEPKAIDEEGEEGKK